jgi:hypothetical protein
VPDILQFLPPIDDKSLTIDDTKMNMSVNKNMISYPANNYLGKMIKMRNNIHNIQEDII